MVCHIWETNCCPFLALPLPGGHEHTVGCWCLTNKYSSGADRNSVLCSGVSVIPFPTQTFCAGLMLNSVVTQTSLMLFIDCFNITFIHWFIHSHYLIIVFSKYEPLSKSHLAKRCRITVDYHIVRSMVINGFHYASAKVQSSLVVICPLEQLRHLCLPIYDYTYSYKKITAMKKSFKQ